MKRKHNLGHNRETMPLKGTMIYSTADVSSGRVQRPVYKTALIIQ